MSDKLLEPDNPYRRLGETLYPALHATYAEAFASLPAPEGLTPVGLAIVLALQVIDRRTAGQAGYLLKMDLRWKYALHLPLDHPGCTGRDLRTFHKRVQIAKPPLTTQMAAIDTTVRHLFTAR
ncbi:MAG: hypothetical protein HGA19_20120 [Oscillochloris sp.]|nr:hypothetical protein [Oscillochloris sp.]